MENTFREECRKRISDCEQRVDKNLSTLRDDASRLMEAQINNINTILTSLRDNFTAKFEENIEKELKRLEKEIGKSEETLSKIALTRKSLESIKQK